MRRAKIADALEAALRQIKEATPTSDIVKRVSVILGAEKETGVIARVIGELAPSHPRAQETGETFVKYGRTMRRREWLAPPKRKPGSAQISLDDAELRRRREAIAAHEAEDEWTVQPPAFLED